MTAGDHVPVILFVEVPGNAEATEPWQKGPIVLNVGAINGFTVTVMVLVPAHCPAAGVKVYTVFPAVAVETEAGLQVPLILLLEVAGSAAGELPWQ
jgi:hypothetical protein